MLSGRGYQIRGTQEKAGSEECAFIFIGYELGRQTFGLYNMDR